MIKKKSDEIILNEIQITANKLNISRPEPGDFDPSNLTRYSTLQKIEIFTKLTSAGHSIREIELFLHRPVYGTSLSRLKSLAKKNVSSTSEDVIPLVTTPKEEISRKKKSRGKK